MPSFLGMLELNMLELNILADVSQNTLWNHAKKILKFERGNPKN